MITSKTAAALVIAAVRLVCLPSVSVAQRPEAPVVEYKVTVTPDGTTTPERTTGQGGYKQAFTVQNGGAYTEVFAISCHGTNVTCTGLSATSITVASASQKSVTATYTAGAVGTGKLVLKAFMVSTDMSDTGYVSVPIVGQAGKPRVDLVTAVVDNIDRGLCFTSGAGESAGVSCGDLFVTHAMPAFRTLGRDRALTLYYNATTARGAVLIPAYVGQQSNTQVATKMKAVLSVGSAKDSAEFGTDPYPTRRQIVLGRGLGRLGTGIYPDTLRVTNVYTASTYDSVLTGSVIVVNRDTSEFGRGWSLLGLEQVLPDPADSTRRLWVAGDGSARIYQRGVPIVSATLSQSGLSAFNSANVNDHNTGNNAWHTDVAVAGAWLRVDLGASPQAATTLGVYARGSSNALYDVQYSDNGTTWRTVYTGFKTPVAGWHWAVWSAAGSHRYWRLLLTNTPGTGSWMAELSLGEPTTFYGAPGDALDSLVRFDTAGAQWYRHDYKHGAKVKLDATGKHRVTVNRLGARTTFNWGTVLGQPRLMSIDVPPNDGTTRRYVFAWNSTTGLLTSITDPASRQLTATMSGGALVRLTDPDDNATRFVYANNRMGARIVPRRGLKGDSAITTFGFLAAGLTDGIRLTSFSVQVDSAQTQYTTTTLVPWDQQGLPAAYAGQQGYPVSDTLGVYTQVDGPTVGLADAINVWVDRFGAPRRLVNVGPNTTTSIYRLGPAAMPGLVTRVDYPTGRRVRMDYNARGSLTGLRDTIPSLAGGGPALPPRMRLYKYTNTSWPDSPTEVHDSINGTARVTKYSYTSAGLTDSVIDPSGHRTKFTYVTTPAPLIGLVGSVIERNVETWRENAADDVTDTAMDAVQAFTYDANGNLRAGTSPVGATTVYTTDAKGRITEVFDPLGAYTRREYDDMNRVTRVVRQNMQVSNPYQIAQLSACDSLQSTCTDHTVNLDPARTDTVRHFFSAATLDSVADPRRVSRAFRVTGLGQVRRETDDFGAAQVGYYGVRGFLDSTRARTGHVTRYYYNGLGQKTAMAYPSVAAADTAHPSAIPGDSVVYAYDSFGQLISSRNQFSTITRTYYADGSLFEKQTAIGTATRKLTYRYDATGAVRMLVSRHDDTQNPGTKWDSTAYQYSNTTGRLDRIIAYWGTPVSRVDTFTFQWDGVGRRRQITYPGPYTMTVKYRYDGSGVLRRVVSSHSRGTSGGSNVFWFTFRNKNVDPAGRIERQELACQGFVGSGDGNPCGVTASLFLDNRYDRLGQLVLQTSSQSGLTDTTKYDASGNMVYRVMAGTPHIYKVVSGHNRLVLDSIPGAANPLAVEYTAGGARHWEHPGTSVSSFRYRSYYYDALGRMTGKRWRDPGSPLTVINSPDACRYDADGQMYKPCDNAAPALAFDGANPVGNFGTDVWTFAHGPGLDDPLSGAFRGTNGATTVVYFVTDGQGRQFAVGGNDGVLQPIDNSGTRSHWRYAGQTKSPNTFDADRMSSANDSKLSYFRNRIYDQETGRWTQEDPIGVAGGLNLYQFNGNNPVSYSDPFGLAPCREFAQRAALVCAVLEYVGGIVGARSGFDKRFPELPNAPAKAAGEISKGIATDLRIKQGFSATNPPSAGGPPSRGLSGSSSTSSLDDGLELLVSAAPFVAAVGGVTGAVAGAVAAVNDAFPAPELGHNPVRCRVERCDGVQTEAQPSGGTIGASN